MPIWIRAAPRSSCLAVDDVTLRFMVFLSRKLTGVSRGRLFRYNRFRRLGRARRQERNLDDAVFYYAFGLFKVGEVIQQIYNRYKQGLTKDERFAHLIHGVRIVCDQALNSIQTGKL